MNDKIKKYIVKISYEAISSEGSGVIVNTDDKYFYILTAKHTFFTHTDNEKMNEDEIEKDKIKILNSQNKNLLLGDKLIKNIIGIEKEYDFLILVIKKNNQINDIKPLSIYEDDFKECKICGYPNSKIADDNKAMLLPCSYNIRHEEKSTYEVNSNILLEAIAQNLNANSKMKGISGSGVFVESATGKLYLAGIQIQTASHNSLVCLDIRILAKEINQALENKNYLPIKIDGYALKEELGINTDNINFDEMLNKLKDKELDGFKDKSYKELIEAFNSGIKQNLDENSKELAKKYLYISLLFHKHKDNRRSTIYFKKAIKNNPSYYALFLKAKDERNLTAKQKEKYDEINSEISNSDISADDLFFEMLEEKLKKIKDFDEKEGVYIQMISLLETRYLDLEKRGEDTTEVKNKIISRYIELFNQYMKEKKFDDANNILNKLMKYSSDIDDKEYKLYTNKDFLTHISLSKLDLSKKYLELLEKYKDSNEKFFELKSQLEKVYSDETDIIQNELKSVKNKIDKNEEKVENLIQAFTNYVKDKEILNKVDFVSTKIDKSTNKITKKLDEVKTTIIKTNNQKLNNFLENVYRSNQALVSKIQTMYHQNDRVNREVKIALDNSIKIINEKIEECLNRPISFDSQAYSNIQTDIEKIIKESNWSFYKAIQGLYEKESDSYNRKLLEMSIAFTKREHELHIEKLKKSHEIELLKIKDKNYSINSKKLSYISEQVSKAHQKLDNISGQLNRFQSNVIDIVKKNNKVLIEELTQIFPEKKDSLKTFLKESDNEINNIDNLSMEQIKEVVSICNDFLYEEIKKLLQNNKDLSKQKIMEMAIELTKKDNEKAIFELEIMYKQKIQQIKEKQTKLEKELDNEKEELYQKNQLLAEYKKKEEEEKRVQEEKEKEHKEFMNQIKLKADLKNKIKLTSDKFYNTKNKIQSFTSAFNNVLEELNKEIQDIKQIIFTKKAEEKYHNIIKELNCKIEELEKVALKKIEDYHNRKEKERKTDIFIILGIVFFIISVYLIFKKIYKF